MAKQSTLTSFNPEIASKYAKELNNSGSDKTASRERYKTVIRCQYFNFI